MAIIQEGIQEGMAIIQEGVVTIQGAGDCNTRRGSQYSRGIQEEMATIHEGGSALPAQPHYRRG